MSHPLARPVIFGLADGSMSILGVIFTASGHASLVLPLATAGAWGAAFSMAGSEYLSQDSPGLVPSLAMGAATFAGAVAPALPYAFLPLSLAVAASVAVCAAVALVVARLRSWRRHRYAETFAVLALIVAVSAAWAVWFGSG